MFQYFLPNEPGEQALEPRIKNQLRALANNDQLSMRLAAMDRSLGRPTRRIFIMGCGRSGTWLITALMSTFKDVCLLAKELPVEYFGIVATDSPTLVIKRNFRSHETVENIPEDIRILYILRHPYDVLTSVNPAEASTGSKYYISPNRWLSEMLALRYLIETGRSNTVVVTYEDLVTNPGEIQGRLSQYFNLERERSPDDILEFDAPPEARLAMHGLRKIDQQSLYRYKGQQEKDYLRKIRPRLGNLLEWVSEVYGYDIDLD